MGVDVKVVIGVLLIVGEGVTLGVDTRLVVDGLWAVAAHGVGGVTISGGVSEDVGVVVIGDISGVVGVGSSGCSDGGDGVGVGVEVVGGVLPLVNDGM